jgi:hypothetical protein
MWNIHTCGGRQTAARITLYYFLLWGRQVKFACIIHFNMQCAILQIHIYVCECVCVCNIHYNRCRLHMWSVGWACELYMEFEYEIYMGYGIWHMYLEYGIWFVYGICDTGGEDTYTHGSTPNSASLRTRRREGFVRGTAFGSAKLPTISKVWVMSLSISISEIWVPYGRVQYWNWMLDWMVSLFTQRIQKRDREKTRSNNNSGKIWNVQPAAHFA